MTLPSDTTVLGKEVAIGKIDKELRLLWEADEASTNASLMNFAVYTEDSSQLEPNTEIVREITREHACRALLVSIDCADCEPNIRAWITAHCNLSHGRKSVCSEQIAFHLTGIAKGRLRNTVFAHLNSDLPLVFWWQGELSFIFEERLYSLIDRLVVDSADWSNPVEQFEKVNEAFKNSSKSLVVQDLAWTRTYHYRLSVAALFDDALAQAELPSVKTLKVKVNPKHRVSGLQLISWVAVQAGWQRSQDLLDDSADRNSYRFVKPNGDLVDVQLEESADSAPIGLLELSGSNIMVKVSREAGARYLHQQLEVNGHVIDQHSPADSDSSAELVTDQLSRGGKNSLFRKVLPQFIDLLK